MRHGMEGDGAFPREHLRVSGGRVGIDLHSRRYSGFNARQAIFNHSASGRFDAHGGGSVQKKPWIRLPASHLVCAEYLVRK